MRFVIRLIVNGVAIWLTSLLLPGVNMNLSGDVTRDLIFVAVVSLVFTLVQSFVQPIARVLSIPFMILTLGLFYFILNALLLLLTGWLTQQLGYGLVIDSFWWALGGSIVISIIATLLSAVLPDGDDARRR